MKLVLKLKLLTCTETNALLRETNQEYGRVCNFVSDCKPEDRKPLRSLTQIEFKPDMAVTYDLRVLTLDTDQHRVSLRTLSRRIWLKFEVGEKRRHLLKYAQGQADLKRYGKQWFLFQTLELPEAEPIAADNYIGVDCGICTVASATDGEKTLRFSGAAIRKTRQHHYELRRGLQRHNTRSSRRRVRKLRDKESRTVRTYNHLVSRRIVAQAKRTNSAIVLENLDGIRAGVKVSKSQRRERFSWAYAQLIGFIVYKAKLEGIPILFVPPDYTSKTCSKCRYMSDLNRTSQAWFRCRKCGFCWNADDNAAINIRFLGAESVRRKRSVSMQEYLHTDRSKPLRFSQG